MREVSMLALVAVLLATATAVQAGPYVGIYTQTGLQATGKVQPGGTIDLLVRMVTADPVSGLVFDVSLPMEGWTLQSYDKATYGWYEQDGLWDGSVPYASACPVVIYDHTFGAAGSPADFRISTAVDSYPDTVTGTLTVMDFTLAIPGSTPYGFYDIALGNLEVTDADGTPYSGVTVQDPSFRLSVADVPEPGTLGMALVGLAALGLCRGRRRKSDQQ